MVSYDWAMVLKARLTLVHPKRAQKPLHRKLEHLISLTFSGVGNKGVTLEVVLGKIFAIIEFII